VNGTRLKPAPLTTTRLATDRPVATPSGDPGDGRAGAGRPTSRRLLVIAAVTPLVLIVLWTAFLVVTQAAPAPARIGTPAPSFALADLDGNPLRLADLHGRPVIVNFWASSCAPCVEEFPLLRAALAKHADDGLAIVGIVYHDRSEAAREFMTRMGATWPAAMDPAGTVAEQFGIFNPPESFFIARDGVIAGRQIGQLSAPDLDRQLLLILGKE
jgi:cytochrome c biogenesis protein CcmG/thiol:disulfide interchange protein DsbE